MKSTSREYLSKIARNRYRISYCNVNAMKFHKNIELSDICCFSFIYLWWHEEKILQQWDHWVFNETICQQQKYSLLSLEKWRKKSLLMNDDIHMLTFLTRLNFDRKNSFNNFSQCKWIIMEIFCVVVVSKWLSSWPIIGMCYNHNLIKFSWYDMNSWRLLL